MKVIVFSDLHAHNYTKFDKDGSRLKNCTSVLIDIFEYAKSNGIKTILFGGDLFDQQKSVPTIVINSVINAFSRAFYDNSAVKFIAISGNHDHGSKNTDTNDADSALFHLSKTFPGRFILLDNMSIDIKDITISGIPYHTHPNHFYDKLKATRSTCDSNHYLLIHQTPQHSNPMIPYDVLKEDFEDFGFVFCGHIHKHERLSKNFVIIGSPLHRDLGDEGLDKGFLVFDTRTNEYERVLLNYPKFKRSNDDEVDNYCMPVFTEELPSKVVEELAEYSLDNSHEALLKAYCDQLGKDEIYYHVGLTFL